VFNSFYYPGSLQYAAREDYLTIGEQRAAVADGVSWAYGPSADMLLVLEGLKNVLQILQQKEPFASTWSEVTAQSLLALYPAESPLDDGVTIGKCVSESMSAQVAYSGKELPISVRQANDWLNGYYAQHFPQKKRSDQRGGACLAAVAIELEKIKVVAVGDSHYLVVLNDGSFIVSENEVSEVETRRSTSFGACLNVAQELGISVWALYKYVFAQHRHLEANVDYAFLDGQPSFMLRQYREFQREEVDMVIVLTDGAVPKSDEAWENKLITAIREQDIEGYFQWLKGVNANGHDKNAPNPEATLVWASMSN